MSLHTRSLKYGKLQGGVLVEVAPSLMRRLKQHFHRFDFGVKVRPTRTPNPTPNPNPNPTSDPNHNPNHKPNPNPNPNPDPKPTLPRSSLV